MEKNLAKTYDPKDFEDRIYEMWAVSYTHLTLPTK